MKEYLIKDDQATKTGRSSALMTGHDGLADQLAPIDGLSYVASYLSALEEEALVVAVDAQPWRADLQRRVQHYGYRYDYRARSVDTTMSLGPLPQWSVALTDRLVADGHLERSPDQMIVNEYQPGQGISPHIDRVDCFGQRVVSVSLGSDCVMDFLRVGGATPALSLVLARRSLLVLTGQARYRWKHGIRSRQSDRIEGRVVRRYRRISLTFRTVIAS